MKKTVTVNLNGRVFTMDEDAYRLLDNYLNNLRIYFRKEEGASEIIVDFEARIEELFSEKILSGNQVITIEHVEEVIARVGKPDDFAEQDDVKDTKEEKQAYFTESKESKKKFYRNVDDKMFGGVCSGIAAYFSWDVLAVRIIFIVLLFATQFLIVPAYLFMWILLPGAFTAEQKLQMRGKPITVENIGKTVAAEKDPVTTNGPKGCLAGFIDFIVGLLKVLLIGIGCLFGLPLIFALFVVIIVLFAALFGVGGGLIGITPSFMAFNHPVLATATFVLVVGIPIVALIYTIIAHFAKLKPMNNPLKVTFIFIWILALILLLFSGFRLNKQSWYNNWNRNWWHVVDRETIRGNGIFLEKTNDIHDPIESVEIGKHLYANLHIEQTGDSISSIIITGDENLVEQVKYELNNGRLIVSSQSPLRSENNLTVLLRSSGVKRIRSNSVGNIKMNRAFVSDVLEIKMSGPTRFKADSLYVQSLNVRSEGVASVELSGKTNNARFELAGAGSIEAMDLISDTVYASVEGIGSIRCNPVDVLEGQLNGIGKITYKDEPREKNISMAGIGKVGRQ